MRPQTIAGNQVDDHPKAVGDDCLQFPEPNQTGGPLRPERDQDVEVAVGAVVAADPGPEQPELRHPEPVGQLAAPLTSWMTAP